MYYSRRCCDRYILGGRLLAGGLLRGFYKTAFLAAEKSPEFCCSFIFNVRAERDSYFLISDCFYYIFRYSLRFFSVPILGQIAGFLWPVKLS